MPLNDSISPLQINSLRGRVLHLPGPHKDSPEVLFIYGHHSSLERWRGVMLLLNQRCAVTMPDLPGFGGMDSLYKIGKSATLDNLADYLADFMRERYQKNQRITIIGMSLGFVITTRMLQRHPDLTKHVSKLVSLFGFAHHNDFILPPRRYRTFLWGSRVFSLPIFAGIYKGVVLNRFVLSRTYHRTPNAREKFRHATPAQQKENMEFEIGLWQNDDLRTYMKTGHEFLTLDNTRVQVDLPVYHIAVARDRYFNKTSVTKHFTQIFREYHLLAELQAGNHAPTQIATANEAKTLIPPELLDAIAPA